MAGISDKHLGEINTNIGKMLKIMESNEKESKRGAIPSPSDTAAAASSQGKSGDSIDPNAIAAMTNGLTSLVEALSDNKIKKGNVTALTSLLDSMGNLSQKLKGDQIKDAGEGVKALSEGLKDFSKNMLMATPGILLGAVTMPLFALSINPLLNVISKIDSKKVTEGSEAMTAMGKGILVFALGIAGGSIAVANADPVGLVSMFGLMGASVMAFDLIASRSKAIKKSSKAIMWMSGGIAAFSLSMYLASQTPVDMGDTAIMLGSMGLSALVFSMIGKHKGNILWGSLAVAGMGLSLSFFSNMVADSVNEMPGFGEMATTMGSLALTGVTYALMGKFASNILMGSLAVAGMGLSLMLISSPLKTISDTVNDNIHALWQVPAILTALGTTFALAGTPPVTALILSGSLAMGAMGLGLMSISSGLEDILKLPTIDDKKAAGITNAIKSVVTGFGQSFSELSMKESLTLPLKIPMVGLMGVALTSLGSGINNWSKNTSGWTENDAVILENTISSISRSFALAGSEEGMSSIFGFSVGKNSAQRGIESTMEMGENLSNLADGIMTWKNMALTPADVQVIGDNISRVLGVIPAVFASIGEVENGSKSGISFLGLSMAMPFEKGNVTAGIEATENLGSTVSDLADGVLAFKDIGKGDVENVKTNLQNLMSVLPSVFGDIGRQDKESEGWFPWSEGDISAGVDLMDKLSPSIKSMADLLNAVKGEDPETQSTKLGSGIKVLVSSYMEAMNQLATSENGADLINVGQSLTTNLSDLSNVFADIKQNTDAVNGSLDNLINLSEPLDKVALAIDKINQSLSDHFTILGSESNRQGMSAYKEWAECVVAISEANVENLSANLKSAFEYVKPEPSTEAISNVAAKPSQPVAAEKALNSPSIDKDTKELMKQLVANNSQMAAAIAQNTAALNQILQTLQGTLKVENDNNAFA